MKMKAYILSIAGIVLISAVVSMIAPSGKMGKFVRGTTKLLILLVMLSPIISWIEGKTELSLSSSNIQTDEAYLERCVSLMEEGDARDISAYLLSEYGVTAEVYTEREADGFFRLQKITVNVTDFGIIGQDGHINIMTRIGEDLEARYGCEVVIS